MEAMSEAHDQPCWTKDVAWQSHRALLSNFPPGASILELCSGAGTASIAMRYLLGQRRFYTVGMFDCNKLFERLASHHNGQYHNASFGHLGDILSHPLSRFPSSNIVICAPPYSSRSCRTADASSSGQLGEPMQRCLAVCAELDRRYCDGSSATPLMSVIIELSLPGSRDARLRESFVADPMVTICDVLGQTWSCRPFPLNASSYGLPQHRRRYCVVCRKRSWYAGCPLLGPPVPFERRIRISEILDDAEAEDIPYPQDTAATLQLWKDLYRPLMRSDVFRGRFAAVDVSLARTSTAFRCPQLQPDLCCHLRSSGPSVHIFSLGEGDGALSIDRPLRPSERAQLQGFPRDFLPDLEDYAEASRLSGGVMPVPVIGSLLAQEMKALMDSVPIADLETAFRPGLLLLHSGFGTTIDAVVGRPLGHLGPLDAPDIPPSLMANTITWGRLMLASWSSGLRERVRRPPLEISEEDDVAYARRPKAIRIESATSEAIRPEASMDTHAQPDADADLPLGQLAFATEGQPRVLPETPESVSIGAASDSDSDVPISTLAT